MKQIEVLFKEGDDGFIEIVEIRNVAKFDDIPYIEYRTGYPSMGIDRNGCLMICENGKSRLNYGLPDADNIAIMLHTKQEFDHLIKVMKQCGENYTKAKKNAENRKKHVIKSIKI
jgi:hypothetical protein